MQKIFFVLSISILLGNLSKSFAQTGGGNFSILNRVADAHSLAIGGNAMLSFDSDLGKALYNPALLNEKMFEAVSYDHVFLNSGIHLSQIGYARENKKFGLNQSFSLQVANYGSMIQTDVEGRQLGTFTPYDIVLQTGVSKKINEQIALGLQAKLIHSGITSFNSQGFYIDFSGIYISKDQRTKASILVRNLGFVFNKFSDKAHTQSPLDIEVNISGKPEHAPFRWMISFEQLQSPDLRYDDPDNYVTNSFDDSVTEDRPSIGNTVLRHLSVGAELLLTEHFNVRLGYDFGRSEELSAKDVGKTTGFSWGFSFKVAKKYKLNYGRSTYHLAGPMNAISLQINLNDFKSKKKEI
ncbi:MAG: type IX secretion system protein PorQ [Flavobacteriales bacterium]|jgi:hypothetical protein|nr:type IX secretion system protein PorQ [Flavobacteriales bacterium]